MIVATAGHVDHGKTALVRNLTGVETDRLEEEQRRGLSINLGYAYWRPDDETTIGFIDVPGHRRFINNMIAGISGIDVGMLVVAADDGPMPQTREHLQVMDLLGVERYIAVVSKCDRVDDRRIEQVREETAALLPAETSIYKVSNTTGDGIDTLRGKLEGLAREWTARAANGHFRMSVDRSFNLHGRGLVLTGTITSGIVNNGDTLVLQPQDKTLRVRGIHVQDAPASAGRAGDRCALNVASDVHRDDIERGDWVAGENCIGNSTVIDARIRLLPDAAFALKHLSTVKLHVGAKYQKARLMLLERDSKGASRIEPGQTALARLVADRPVLCCRGDRFLLRDHGETATLGGGTVLDPQGATAQKVSRERLAFLEAMENSEIESAIRDACERQCVIDYGALLRAWNVDALDSPGKELPGIARVETANGEYWLAESRWSDLQQAVLKTLSELSEAETSGVAPERLARAAMAAGERGLFEALIAALQASGEISLTNGLLSIKATEPEAAANDDPGWTAIASCLRKHGRQIPNLSQLQEECGLPKAALQQSLGLAQRDRRLVKINATRYAEASLLREFAEAALELADAHSRFTVAQFRDRLGCGRNVLIEVLEYFDSIGFTRRVGNARIVLDSEAPDRKLTA